MAETYTIQDIAGMTGLNERTIRSYLADGLLKGEKTDGAWRFTAEQFGDFLRQDMVRASVQAKANAVVYDFLITDRRKESAACLILDQPSAEDQEPGLREALSEQVNRLELRWAYRYRDGMARSILSGPPAALGELLARMKN
ncbi:MAG: helix-turn-helix domain-containing protein [Oscillospiraceae bacterium]|nr:helix-turn-helix domain-containing protein [Oscillospiraceae bacterium]